MYFREVQIEDDKSVGDSGTLTVDINIKDPITALIVRFKVKNGAATVVNEPVEVQISKVELVDGGQVYYSLNGPMAVAAACYGLGKWPHSWYDERANNNQRINFPLLFGRYLGDPEFGFDPTRLVNPQLKITWADQALYLDDQHQIGITARVMEGVPAPSKCLLWKEIEAWTSAASGVHTVDLPTDYPYRALLIRPYEAGTIPTSVITNFKLDCDVGKLIPFDLASHEFRDVIKQYDGPFQYRNFCRGSHATLREAWLGETFGVQATPESNGYMAFTYTAFWSFYYMNVMLHDGTDSPTVAAQVVPNGLFPHSCYKYPFGVENDPATWFNARGFGDIDLKLTEGSINAAVAVAVQQPRSLP